jgi:cytidyltransferase-like protein
MKKYLDDPHFWRIMNSLMNIELTTVVASGYFDPLHVGHIEYLEKAKQLGDKLVVIVNSDVQAKIKKGKAFMQEEDRLKIVKSLKCVDEAFISIDNNSSVCKSLRLAKPHIFANGGDRKQEEIPEARVCEELGIEMIDGLGEKIRSSSDYNKKL